jgi:hypothetical protein
MTTPLPSARLLDVKGLFRSNVVLELSTIASAPPLNPVGADPRPRLAWHHAKDDSGADGQAISKFAPSYVIGNNLRDPPRTAHHVGCAEVLSTHQEIEQEIEKLSSSMPGLLRGSQGSEFWIEFMERADAIKDGAPLNCRDGITQKLHELLARYGISPPWRWATGNTVKAARIYDFHSGLRLG